MLYRKRITEDIHLPGSSVVVTVDLAARATPIIADITTKDNQIALGDVMALLNEKKNDRSGRPISPLFQCYYFFFFFFFLIARRYGFRHVFPFCFVFSFSLGQEKKTTDAGQGRKWQFDLCQHWPKLSSTGNFFILLFLLLLFPSSSSSQFC